MYEGKKAGDVLATADFHLTGTGWNGKPVDETVHATLAVSGASQYGNQTCMAFEWSNTDPEYFDTRYDRVSPETFTEFAKEVLEDRLLKTVKVEVM